MEGVITEILFEADSVVQVGEVIAVIETGDVLPVIPESEETEEKAADIAASIEKGVKELRTDHVVDKVSSSGKFFSPLVRNIAKTEGISMQELETIVGTGKDGRVTKNDILAYLEKGRTSGISCFTN